MLTPVQLPFGKTIFQTTNGHSITSDSAFLVKTISDQISRPDINLLELGSGNGIISIMLSHYNPEWKIIGIEIQKHLVELSQDNTKLSETHSTFVEADLRAFTSSHKYDLIIFNPPYFAKDKGRISPIQERAISRQEIACNMLDIMECIKRNLKIDGSAFILYPKYREQDIDNFAKKVDLKAMKKFVLDSEGNKKKIIVELIHA